MFDTITAGILNKFLGDYLNITHLDMSLWQGDITVSDISIKSTALNTFKLPYQVVAGNVGRLEMKLPWRNLAKNPVEIVLKDVYLVAVPSKTVPYDQEAEEHALLSYKMNRLQQIEATERSIIQQRLSAKAADTSSNGTTKVAGSASFSQNLIADILRNLKISIESIHIRYEDDVPTIHNYDASFSFGIVLSSLTIETTNSESIPIFITATNSTSYKLVNLHGLAIYINSGGNLTTDDKTPSDESKTDIIMALGELIMSEDDLLDYIVGPISTSMQIKLTENPEKSSPPFSIPRVVAEMTMRQLKLGMSSIQFQNIVRLVRSIEFMGKAQIWRKHRPNVNQYKGYYKEWWNFAINCTIDEVERIHKFSWRNIKRHRALCKEYTDALVYQKFSNTYFNLPLKWTRHVFFINNSPEESIRIAEENLDILNLVLARKKAEIRSERHDAFNSQHYQSGFLSVLWNWQIIEEPTSEERTDYLNRPWNKEEKQMLIEMANYCDFQEPPQVASTSATKNYPEEYAEFRANFHLKEMILLVRESEHSVEGNELIKMRIESLENSFDVRPENNGLKLDLKIRNIKMSEINKNEGGADTCLMKAGNQGSDENFFHMYYEKFPSNLPVNEKLTFSANTIEIFNLANTIHKINHCFRGRKAHPQRISKLVADSVLEHIMENYSDENRS